jgi:NADP-dependent 3-hydroxy acid dehydrogenase YdfG
MNKPLVIITGASSRIGAAIAKVFSDAGYPLGLLARNLDAMKKLNLIIINKIRMSWQASI